ncbi:Class A beta-lactamase-related serine hydrolase [Tenacibaculum sp. 190524A02b]|uniref:serine hydrolase domain-containing protein n=1 Tax=Tenacibaculum vairaonense TaxID=3137860 RepID=UPI0032B21FBC
MLRPIHSFQKKLKHLTIQYLTFILLTSSFYTKAQYLDIDTTKINKTLLSLHKKNDFSGTVIIKQKDKILYQNHFGYSDIKNKTSFNYNTKFQIASLSKQFTSFGILILEQENLLTTNDFVSKHIPDFPFPTIQIKHLMSHTSGLPNFVKTMWKDLDTTKVNGNAIMLSMLKSNKYPLQWEPGTKFEYSDIGYCLLAIIIENVSGVDFKTFMKQKLFTPSGMYNTNAEFVTDTRSLNYKELAKGYELNKTSNQLLIANQLPSNNYVYWLGGFYGDGSVISTAKDLLKWDKALYQNTVISKKSLQKAMTPFTLNNGLLSKAWGTNYGLGWFLYKSPVFGIIQTHSGEQPGYRSRLVRAPEKQLTIVILSNISNPNFNQINILKILEEQL